MEISGKIEQYQEEIHKRNCKNFVALTWGGTIITGAIVFIGFCMRSYTEFLLEYTCFFIYMLLLCLLARYCEKHQIKHIEAIYYCAITPIMAGGILMGTFLDPDQPALIIMVLLCVIMLFVIDKIWRIFAYTFAVAIIFTVCSYLSKDVYWFKTDLLDILIFLSISMGVNYFMLKGHVESVENYCMVQIKSEMDILTGIMNRGTGEMKTAQMIESHVPGAFVILDIDEFKSVNDHFGHQVGDEVICEIAHILKMVFRPQDVVFRLGGDEFAVFAPNLTDEELCRQRFKDMKEAAAHIVTSDKNCNAVGISIGCTICMGGKNVFEKIYRSSDENLYAAKNGGKGKAVITCLDGR